MVGCLAVVDTQLLLPVIVACGIINAERGTGRHHHCYGRVETDVEFILPFFQQALHRDLVPQEHVLGPQDARTVEKNVGMGIQSFKKEQRSIILELIGSERECFFEIPVLLLHPLYFSFVGTVKRIREDAQTNQIMLNRSRHFSLIPL